jgi:hypothetical protein
MAAHGVFQPAAEGETVDRRHDGLAAAVHDVIGALPQRCPLPAGAEAANVRAGDEAAAVAHQHHGLDRGIAVGLVQTFDDPVGHARPERVDGRVVDDDDADIAVFFQADDRLVGHRVRSSVWLGRR